MKYLLLLSTLCALVGCTGKNPALNAYDAVSLFGFGEATKESMPAPNRDTLVIRYGGWSLNDLRDARIDGKILEYYDSGYADEPWAKEKFPPGVYTFTDQEPIPAVLLASALLTHKMQHTEFDWEDDRSVLMRIVDRMECKKGGRDDLVGFYFSDDIGDEGKVLDTYLFVEKAYCNVPGGGIWEGKI